MFTLKEFRDTTLVYLNDSDNEPVKAYRVKGRASLHPDNVVLESFDRSHRIVRHKDDRARPVISPLLNV